MNRVGPSGGGSSEEIDREGRYTMARDIVIEVPEY